MDSVIIPYHCVDGNGQLDGYAYEKKHIFAGGGKMGYRITYFREEKRATWSRAILLTLLFFAIFLGWTFRNWEEGGSLILRSLFPVTAEETCEAAGEMAERIGGGSGVVQAFTEFFQSVLPDEVEGAY